MKLIGSDEVLEILGIRKPTLYAWVHRGKLTAYKVGKLLKFNEEEIRAMITLTATYGWVATGPLQTAIDSASRLVAVKSPDLRLVYLQSPEPFRARVRVQAFEEARGWTDPAVTPGGGTYRQLEGLKKEDAYLFLGTSDPWKVIDIRIEGETGGSYLAVWIERVATGATERTAEAVKRLHAGIIAGKIEPWTREGLYRRGGG